MPNILDQLRAQATPQMAANPEVQSAEPQGNILQQLRAQARPQMSLPQVPNSQMPVEGQFTQSAPSMALESLGQSVNEGNAMAGVKGLGEGAYQALQGAGQGILRTGNAANLISDDNLNAYTAKMKADSESFDKNNPNGAPARLAGQIDAWLGVGKALPIGGTGIGGALASIGTGAVSGALQPSENNDEFLKNIAVGGALGGVASGVNQTIKALSAIKSAEPAIQATVNPTILKNKAEALINSNTSGKDIVDSLTNHIKGTKQALKDVATAKYNKLYTAAEQVGQPIRLDNLTQRINVAKDTLGTQLPGFQVEGTGPLMDRLEQMGQTLKTNPNVSPQQFQDMRTQLGKLANTSTVSDIEKQTINSLIGGLDQDLSSFAKNSDNPEIKTLFNQAKDYYANTYQTYKNNNLVAYYTNPKNLEQPQVMSQIFNNIMKPKNTEALSAIRPSTELNKDLGNQLVQNAFTEAFKDNEFVPKAFMNSLNKNMSLLKVTVNPKTLEQIKGYSNLLKTIDNPVDGGVIGFASHFLNKASPGLASAVNNNGALILSKALQYQPTKALFNAAAKLDPNSPAAKRIVTSILTTLPKLDKKSSAIPSRGFLTPDSLTRKPDLDLTDDSE